MKIAVLTSSRADYGIYLPLLKKLKEDDFFELKLLVFGTHLSRYHGYTISQIEEDGFEISEQIESLILGDTKEAISNAIGNTIIKFSTIWRKLENDIDLVLTLGDRYEMFAAVAATVPFNLKVAHLHGGETTLGAIDNKFRHMITLMSSIHFVSTQRYADKVENLIGQAENIHNVGSLSLDNLLTMSLYSIEDFNDKFNIDLSIPTILSTFHPETVSVEKNREYALILSDIFKELSSEFQVIITMPNADTKGSLIREIFTKLAQENNNILGVENFGTRGYFSCMKHSSFLLGNTSSGIIEAASFGKYVIDIGRRQEGRSKSENVINVPINYAEILSTVSELTKETTSYKGTNVYRSKRSSGDDIINILKTYFHSINPIKNPIKNYKN